jgi:hypothetical protein
MHYAQADNYLWPQHQRIANYHICRPVTFVICSGTFLTNKGKTANKVTLNE